MKKPTKKAIELLQPVLAWLDELIENPQHQKMKEIPFGFNMDMFYGLYGRGSECGTVCCIAGAVAYLNFPKEKARVMEISKVADIMGMTDIQMFRLFYACDGRREFGNMLPQYGKNRNALAVATPKQAIECIRGWIETGEINWGAE